MLSPISGYCGAPFETEDPNTVAAGHLELLLFYQSTLEASGRSGSAPGFDLHYGAFDGLELDGTVSLAFDATRSGTTQWGYGDTTLGVKYRIVPESKLLPLVSFVPKLVVPTGNANRGLGNGGSKIFVAGAAQKTSGSFQTYANAGYWINNGVGNRNYWFFGWQAQYQVSNSWTLGAEVFHTTGQSLGESASTGFNIGGYWSLGPRSQLLFSGGRGLQNAAETNRVSAYVGLQLSF